MSFSFSFKYWVGNAYYVGKLDIAICNFQTCFQQNLENLYLQARKLPLSSYTKYYLLDQLEPII